MKINQLRYFLAIADKGSVLTYALARFQALRPDVHTGAWHHGEAARPSGLTYS